MPEPLLLAIGLGVAFAAVLLPLRAPRRSVPDDDAADREARHRAAIEALRDVEVDHRAGTLSGAAYETERAAAEQRAVATRRALALPETHAGLPAATGDRRAARVVGVAGVVLAAGLLGASFVPALGVANGTVVDQALADARAREADRQERIAGLLDGLAENPDDPDLISDLADAYLAGSTIDDLAVAATLLRGLIDLDPDRADAFERIIAAYIRAEAYGDARAAHDAYSEIASADPIELAFLDGLIALRGEEDAERALTAFDRFLAEAPDDARAPMVRGLRHEAAAALASSPPSAPPASP